MKTRQKLDEYKQEFYRKFVDVGGMIIRSTNNEPFINAKAEEVWQFIEKLII